MTNELTWLLLEVIDDMSPTITFCAARIAEANVKNKNNNIV